MYECRVRVFLKEQDTLITKKIIGIEVVWGYDYNRHIGVFLKVNC